MEKIQIVQDHIAEFKQMLIDNPDFKNELFDNEYADQEVFWKFFEEQCIVNFLENSEPSLTTEQLKDVHKKMFLHSIVDTMEELRKKGFVDGDEISGYTLTNTAKQILNESNNI